jgi:hypothetical protein
MRIVTSLFALLFAGALVSAQALAADTNTHPATKKTTVAQQHRTHRTTHTTTPSYTSSYNSYSSTAPASPWDFSGQLLIWNPGVGFHALAAYRVLDNVVPNLDNSLSVESGLGFVSISDSVNGLGVSYSFIEIPIMARWDIRIRDSNFIVGPRAGFEYLAGGGSVTVNGVNVNVRGNSLYFQFGGFGEYKFNSQWAARVDLMLVNWTAINLGVAYFL